MPEILGIPEEGPKLWWLKGVIIGFLLGVVYVIPFLFLLGGEDLIFLHGFDFIIYIYFKILPPAIFKHRAIELLLIHPLWIPMHWAFWGLVIGGISQMFANRNYRKREERRNAHPIQL